ncbi:MAG: LacI family transcriptional regulator [Dysgonamonadaceae bacterium]|jgi:LacI family transcriptional regulator|nr:LacI family transcriptional regulator [Dysgonamonadaceae bacterium]
MTRISMKDIARELGVSIATVSLVLNGKDKDGRVGKEMAEKIRRKAKEMNYEPNNLARGLRIGVSNTIGLIVADISNLFFANLAFHIQEQAEKFGYSVIITNTNESNLKLEKMITILKNKLVDGFIIVPTEHGESLIQNLVKRNMPVVLIDRYFPNLNVSSVIVDNYNASKKALRCLINQGCRNIGLVIYKSDLQHMLDRKKGYVDELQNAGLYNPALIKEINYSSITDDITIAMESLLSRENEVDGIFFATNTLSMLSIKYMLDMNIKLYEEIKVVCFDKSDAFDFTSLHISYIQQPIAEMGTNAVGLLVEQMKRKSVERKEDEIKIVELQTFLMNVL